MASTGQVNTMNKTGLLKVTDSLDALLLKQCLVSTGQDEILIQVSGRRRQLN